MNVDQQANLSVSQRQTMRLLSDCIANTIADLYGAKAEWGTRNSTDEFVLRQVTQKPYRSDTDDKDTDKKVNLLMKKMQRALDEQIKLNEEKDDLRKPFVSRFLMSKGLLSFEYLWLLEDNLLQPFFTEVEEKTNDPKISKELKKRVLYPHVCDLKDRLINETKTLNAMFGLNLQPTDLLHDVLGMPREEILTEKRS